VDADGGGTPMRYREQFAHRRGEKRHDRGALGLPTRLHYGGSGGVRPPAGGAEGLALLRRVQGPSACTAQRYGGSK
jgi:hypothetical protein